MKAKYENRYVAFIDILGFSDLIKRSCGSSPSVTIDEVIEALEIPQQVQLDGIVLGRIGDISVAAHRISAFSDCVAISTDANEQGLMNLLFHVRAILFRLLRLGFLTRGGIVQGLIYHREGLILGPALIEAYALESKVAIFPRVILQQEIVESALCAEPPINQIFERLTRRNDDGKYMVHSLWALRSIADSESGFSGENLELVNKMHRFLDGEEARLLTSNSVRELEKIRWFKEYFLWAIDRQWVNELNAPFPA